MKTFFSLLLLTLTLSLSAEVLVGCEVIENDPNFFKKLEGKKVGLITNQTGMNRKLEKTSDLIKKKAKLKALFAPEHGLDGSTHAGNRVNCSRTSDGIPIFSLHGQTRRPTDDMLKGLDVIIYDIQDIGSRSYTFSTTLFYVMEEAGKRGIEVIVLDRPNPINGITIDGPILEKDFRSFLGYVNVPYCHGMTIGELARYFVGEYGIKCKLTVIPMKGWKREMTYTDTKLPWIPTSPNIPEKDSPFYYPTTGIIGELSIVSTGIGYTLPFKVIGAPWINAETFAEKLNGQKFAGVLFCPFHFTPYSGIHAKKECHGVLIQVTDPLVFKPVTTQYLILGILKSLYPKEFQKGLALSHDKKEMFSKVNGTDKVWTIIHNEPYVTWKLKALHEKERAAFLKKREKYLLY